MPRTQTPKSRRWCFTCYDMDHVKHTLCQVYTQGDCSYIVYQHEICPKTNKEHVQGYIEFANMHTLGQVKNLVGHTSHCEMARGTPTEASAYCKKDDTRKPGSLIVEEGTIKQQGKRSDLLRAKEIIDSGGCMKDLREECFGVTIRHDRALNAYRQESIPDRSHKTIVIAITGPTRVGKSRAARELFPNACWIDNGNNGVWWDNYNQEDCVVLDEFNGG